MVSVVKEHARAEHEITHVICSLSSRRDDIWTLRYFLVRYINLGSRNRNLSVSDFVLVLLKPKNTEYKIEKIQNTWNKIIERFFLYVLQIDKEDLKVGKK